MQTILISNGLFLASAGLAADYVVRIDESLKRMHVSATFDEPPRRISARAREASRYLGKATTCDGMRLSDRGNVLQIADRKVTCIEYTVNLARAARDERRNTRLDKKNAIVSSAVWLWRPGTSHDGGITVRFDTDVDVSVPWPAIDASRKHYRIPESPRSAYAPTAFGNFVYREIDASGARFRVTFMRDSSGDARTDLAAWISETAGNVALAYGRFPNPNPSVVVIPSASRGWSSSPVPFGRVVRDGGEAIELFVDARASVDDFYDDWTATHEFSHLMLPYLRRDYRWISEGFAQYYQNLLLARAGRYSEQEAWQKIYEGFERGRNSRPELSPNDAAEEGIRAATMKIYWSGAAVALMADVELRTQGSSLDAVLDELAGCCLPSAERWSGPRFLAKLDDFIDDPVFMPLYRRYANTDGFPETATLLERLGVIVDEGSVDLDDEAELASLRRALTGH